MITLRYAWLVALSGTGSWPSALLASLTRVVTRLGVGSECINRPLGPSSGIVRRIFPCLDPLPGKSADRSALGNAEAFLENTEAYPLYKHPRSLRHYRPAVKRS